MNEISDIWQFLLLGLGIGPAYALAALALVVVHRGSGVVNFANGAFAMLGGWVYFEATSQGVPQVAGMALGVMAGAAAGLGTHAIVMRRLDGAAQLTRVIATLGVAIIGQQALTLAIGIDTLFPEALFSQSQVRVLGAGVSGYFLIMLVLSIALTAGLWALYRFTAFGLRTTAVAENRRAAAALGWSPQLIAALNWGLGGALAALGGVLIAPVIGLSVVTLPLLLVPSLAAALLGRFNAFWLTLLGGLVIGIGESELTRFNIGPGWSTAFPFLLILAVLFLRSSALPQRGEMQAHLPAIGSGTIRPAIVLPALAAGVVFAILLSGAGSAAIATSAAAATILLSWVVVTGYAGQVSLAQLSLAGVGAFIAARLAATLGFSFWLALPVAVLVTIPIGAVVGLPALRTRGVNLAIATLGLGLVIETVVLGNASYTGGLEGTVVSPPSLFGFDLSAELHPSRYAILALLALTLCAFIVANLRRGRVGRELIAVRASELAAASLGINVTWTKLYAFVVSAGIAAMGGVVMAYQTTNVIFSQFSVTGSIALLGFIVVGGIGYIGGSLAALAAAGGVFAWVLSVLFEGGQIGTWLALAGGVGVVATILTMPDGVAGGVAARVAGRRGARREADASVRRAGEPLQDRTGGQIDVEPVSDCRLEIDALTVRFGGLTALEDASLRLRSGEVLGLIGPNGAGKTTLIDVISGITRGYEGTIQLNGRRIDRWTPMRRARAGIGRSFQGLELFEDLSVEDNLRVGAEGPDARRYLLDLLRPESKPLFGAAWAAAKEFELERSLGRKPSQLSHGERRLVGIARAVAGRSPVLLLDEPAAGLDERQSKKLASLLGRLAHEWNFAVLLVEHDMGLVMSTCDRIIALDFGKVIASGSPEEVRHDRAVVASYLGDPGQAPGQQANASGVPV